MGRKKIIVDQTDLIKLYWDERKSLKRVAKILGCTDGTIIRRMREMGISRRSKTTMRIKYPKILFDGSLAEKSYMVGFRIGDLSVYKPSPKSSIFVVRCHTTMQDQVKLIQSLFQRYGGVRTSCNNNHFNITCYLNDSFGFLLDKTMPGWVFTNPISGMSFIAGYTDAEGSFGLNQGRGRFKIDSYDREVLKGITQFLSTHNINVKLQMIATKGENYGNGLKWNNDLWRLNINDALSLEKFINQLLPFLKHKKRIVDAKIVLKNINDRKFAGTI